MEKLNLIFYYGDDKQSLLEPNFTYKESLSEELQQLMVHPPVELMNDEIIISMDNTSTLGTFFKNLRQYHNWTQKELVEFAGVSLQYISQIERGVFLPSPKTITSLLKVLLTPRQIPTLETKTPAKDWSGQIKRETFAGINQPHPDLSVELILQKDEIDNLINRLYYTYDASLYSITEHTLQNIIRIAALRAYASDEPEKREALIEKYANQFHQELLALFIQIKNDDIN